MSVNEQDSRYDRLAIRLSVIISRLLAGETLSLKSLVDEFGVSERTLQRDFNQRLIHLDILDENGRYRLNDCQPPDHSSGAFSFIRTTGIARIIPVQDRQLMNLLMNESGTSPCLIWHAPLKSHVALPEFFSRLVQAISQKRQVTVLVEGQRHEALEPYRLIHYVEEWYLVVCQSGKIRVFALTSIGAVTLDEVRFKRREDISYLTAGEGFIAALPHFPLISDVIDTFRY